VRSWNLHEIEVEGGSRSPVVLDSDEAARAVLIVLDPNQSLGDHQVKEHAYVLVVDGKVLQIANQDNKDLATHAGHTVRLTGEMKGSAITVSKIEMPRKN